MIAEVNNTFDERRMYFLPENMGRPLVSSRMGVENSGFDASHGTNPNRLNGRFKYCWDKDFHVSPFNSRKGSYTLIASDPLMALTEIHRVIRTPGKVVDVTVTLISSKKRPKMVAYLRSVEVLDPDTMSPFDILVFFVKWWWVGLLTCKS